MRGATGQSRLEPRRRAWVSWDPHSYDQVRESRGERQGIDELRRQREVLQTECNATKAELRRARAEAQASFRGMRELAVLVAKLNADLQSLKHAKVVDPLLTLFPDLDTEENEIASTKPLPPSLFSAIVADDE